MIHLPFTKLQGAGNDFVILNNMELKLDPACFNALAKRVCTPHVSLGANSLMVADFPERGGDLRMRFYNADGTEGEMCGNGARCLARYAFEKGLAGEAMVIETVAGDVYAWRRTQREYRIKLNDPSVLKLDYPVEVDGVAYECSYVELGNPGIPHAVVHTPGLAGMDPEELRELGKALRYHSAFPKGANVNFWDLEADGTVRELTYERGVEDFTLACGTGSGSVSTVLTLRGLTQANPVCLNMRGGQLKVELDLKDGAVESLYLIGDTNVVADGVLTDEDIEL